MGAELNTNGQLAFLITKVKGKNGNRLFRN